MENIKKLNWSWHQIRVPPMNLQFFSQNFEDRRDVVYCHLNEIEPLFLAENKNETDEEDDIVLDPRNGAHVTNVIVNIRNSSLSSKAHKIFPNFPTKSSLSRDMHRICLQVLKAKQNKIQCSADDLKKYEQTTGKRTAEHKLFNDFLRDYFSANFEEVYEIGKEICQQYQRYLSEVVTIFLQCPNKYFTLQTALPLHYDAENIFSEIQTKILYSDGLVALFEEENDTIFNLKNTRQDMHEKYLQNLQNFSFFSVEEKYMEFKSASDVILPEETLLALLGILSKDLSAWDIPLTIEEKCSTDAFSESNKYLTFNKPLPKRIFSLKDAASIYDSLLEYHVKLSKNMNWLNLSDGTFKSESTENDHNEEIFAVDLNLTYKLPPIGKYMETVKTPNNFINNEITAKKNFILVEWNLSSKNLNLKPFKILTRRNVCLCTKQGENFKLLNTSLKLEFKRQFGAEVMAKSELINEWIKQSLTPDSYTQRVRLDAKTLEPILQQSLNTTDIEEELLRLYNINPSDLVTSLHGFFTMLLNLPPGDYLLRCDPMQKHKNQIMVYSKLLKCTETALSIHGLYKDTGSIQTTEAEFVPIDNCVITPMHVHYSVLPACFPPWGAKKEIGFNDQADILRRVKQQQEQKEAHREHLKKMAKNRRKKVKAEKRKKSKQIENAKEVEGFSFIDEENFYSVGEVASISMKNDYNEKENTNSAAQKPPTYEAFNLEQYLAEAYASISNSDKEQSTKNNNDG